MKQKLSYTLYGVLCTVILTGLICYPARYMQVTLQGFALWLRCVLPCLFPFMICCGILTATGILQGLAKPLSPLQRKLKLPTVAVSCCLLSLSCGYPVGARTVKQFADQGLLDKKQINSVALLASSTSPIFALSSVGASMFGNTTVGGKLFLCHAVAVIFVGLVAHFLSKPDEQKARPLSTASKENIFYDCVYNAVISVAVAGGYIAFFGVLTAVLEDFYLLYPLQYVANTLFGDCGKGLCFGLIEMTNGCLLLSRTENPFALPLCGFLVTTGGLCILMQQLGYLKSVGVNTPRFLLGKVCQGVLCAMLLWACG